MESLLAVDGKTDIEICMRLHSLSLNCDTLEAALMEFWSALDITQYIRDAVQNAIAPIEDAVERCALRFCVEAVHCLQDGIIASARDGDIGAVFGVGFPPFRGGPFMWMDTLGPQVVVQKLQKLEAEFGPHFAPPQLLVDKAAKGELFHQ